MLYVPSHLKNVQGKHYFPMLFTDKIQENSGAHPDNCLCCHESQTLLLTAFRALCITLCGHAHEHTTRNMLVLPGKCKVGSGWTVFNSTWCSCVFSCTPSLDFGDQFQRALYRLCLPRSRSPTCQRVFETRFPVNCACLHPNQCELFVGEQSGNVHMWDLRTNQNQSVVGLA